MIPLIIFNTIFIALGVVVLFGKGDFLIAGYNTASKEQKQKVNIKRLRLVVALILFMTAALISSPFILGYENDATTHIATTMFVVIIVIAGVIIANTWCMKK